MDTNIIRVNFDIGSTSGFLPKSVTSAELILPH